MGIGILGLGKCIPAKSISNAELEEWTGLPLGTIEAKTGIQNRYVAETGVTASQLSVSASRMALERARVAPEDLNLILGCTFTADYWYPALACKVHRELRATRAAAYDLMANCTAFQVGLMTASDRLLADPQSSYALVIGAALQSPLINWKDPSTAIYFGDGAGAAVLGRVPEGYGMLASEVFTQSSAYESVRLRGGEDPKGRYYEMDGMEVWKQVIQYQPLVIKKVVEKAGLTLSDVDFFIFHQANLKLIEFLMAKLRLQADKTYTNVARIGNTAEASMAIALCEAVEQEKIGKEANVLISGVGAGFTFGASLMRWYE